MRTLPVGGAFLTSCGGRGDTPKFLSGLTLQVEPEWQQRCGFVLSDSTTS